MARLLRIHFASIGHRDARLAPLTLDFRDPQTREAVDTVLWLRNGGGKSSILNLFFSLFRPNRREFLGSSAEAGDRKLEEYVQDSDLAWVVSEWSEGGASSQGSLFEGDAAAPTRVVGQVMAWQGQQQSSDAGRLKRLFFTFRGRREVLDFDTLPIAGLGTPLRSLQEVREFLDQAASSHPGLELVRTEHLRKWRDALVRVGLDPELFRYQLAMNRREGAADEAFRFGSSEDFIDFLLEVAYDGAGAEQTADLLDKQREALRRRPGDELERTFLSRALDELAGLVSSAAAERVAQTNLASRLTELCALRAAHDASIEQYRERELEAEADRAAATEQLRVAVNARDKHVRWAGGYARCALELDVSEAKAWFEAEQKHVEELDRLCRAQAAAALWREVKRREATVAELARALDERHRSLAPDKARLAAAGDELFAALTISARELALAVLSARQEAAAAQAAGASARASADAALRDGESAKASETQQRRWLERRDKRRADLVTAGHLQPRAVPAEALASARTSAERARSASAGFEADRAEHQRRASEAGERRGELCAARAELVAQLEQERRELARARDERDRLATDALLLEIEGVDEGRPESQGLPRRLRDAAGRSRRAATDARLAGADDERVLQAIEREGLAPPPPAVARVLEALTAAGAHPLYGPAYLAETAGDEAPAWLAAQPQRYGGVVVQNPAELDEARRLGLDDELRASVVVHATGPLPGHQPPASTPATAASPGPVTLGPYPAAYTRKAAGALADRLVLERDKRDTRVTTLLERSDALTELARAVTAFQTSHGGGKLDELAARVSAKAAHAAGLATQIEEARHEQEALEARVETLVGERDERASEARGFDVSASALEHFVGQFEVRVDEVRTALDQALAKRKAAAEQALQARELEDLEAERRRKALDSASALERERGALTEERDGIEYRTSDGDGDEAVTATEDLATAQATYRERRDRYEAQLGEGELAGRLSALRGELEPRRTQLTRSLVGLNEGEVESLARRADLDAATVAAKAEFEAQRERAVEAKVNAKQAAERLSENPRRREAADLPPETARPATADDARRREREQRVHATTCADEARAAEERKALARERAANIERRAERLLGYRSRLEQAADAVHGLDAPVPPGPRAQEAGAVTLPSERAAIEGLVDAAILGLQAADKTTRRATDARTQAAHRVQRVATDDRFSTLRHQYKERLKGEADELADKAETYQRQLADRRVVLDAKLAALDDDRRILLNALVDLGDKARLLIDRTGRASELPASLQGWSGKPYLRIRHRFPETREEAHGLLGPFVDRLVKKAQLPGGAALLKQTVRELGGGRFAVTILKPDARLRADRVPISEMSKFSRGQQLTAAILLYCTLVQLRARSRGHGRKVDDAGPLLLDNPIGTCSSVPLLELQMTIAHQMGVQLIYATGVDDLEALDTLPNKIRLRNVHRDRRTGEHHVTRDEEREVGAPLEAVRALTLRRP